MPKLDNLISKSLQSSVNINLENSLADRISNADKTLRLLDEPLTNKKRSIVKNLTFTFGLNEVKIIDEQVERFLKQGKNVSKSELMRIGLKLIENTEDKDLPKLSTMITKFARGRQS